MTAQQPDLSLLTGLRSGKSTFYPQYRGAAERLERVVHALELISRALVRTVDGPETLICAVAEAARAHLSAQWVVFALADGALPDAGPRRLVLGPDATPFLVDNVVGPPLPDDVVECLESIRLARIGDGREPQIESHHAFVPIALDGGVVGAFAAWTSTHRVLDATDSAVLSILASQTAVALQNSALYQSRRVLLERAESAYSEAHRTAADLAVRNAELEATQRQLGAAHRHQVLDEERHRIARELHDSVTQAVLSAGMQIEVCLGDIPAGERAERLDLAKDLTRRAVEQLRSAIYALNHAQDADRTSLPEMLEQLSVVHMPDELQVSLRVEGTPVELGSDCEHDLLRIAGEALFNTAVHAGAHRAVIRLAYREGGVSLSIADDGTGDPAHLRLMQRLAENNDVDGRHRGLANMAARAREHGGVLEIRRARIGGVRISVRIPSRGE
ncbi:sensor histidine kinase [Rhodococcus sp. RS1C4]|uniref:MadS family sensor histidine kinase n=1 Tax=Nocardiaceae TaxID=85025 RepID=UPI0003688C82|nr:MULTISPECIES: histidine kinase [Rhodococcus]OZC55726.1 sensor histidine kinase [Rhodococcus sp. 06-621-2]OZC58880.1 sensor histidine kinase [Rhodococcus sp. RS1C4]OZD07602.1 sensor histidine kinase [Rhodococcus sp. 06-156-4C]OZD17188.1 sensor histidine kinase [Rhodococcus sp. 06-156-3C]OZD18526.1 sensor histidine kinase [Rhodococcus sp. 06-156-4a]